MIYYSPLFSVTDCSGGLKLKPDVLANENEPASKFTEAPADCSGLLNTKPVPPSVWELSALVPAALVCSGLLNTKPVPPSVSELSAHVAAALAGDDSAEPKLKDATVHVAGGLKLKPTMTQLFMTVKHGCKYTVLDKLTTFCHTTNIIIF